MASFSKVVNAVVGQASGGVVPTGKTFGGKKRKGLMARVAEKVTEGAGAPGVRHTTPRSDDEGGRGLMSSVMRKVRRGY